MAGSPIDLLMRMPKRQQRVDAIAADLKSGTMQFASIVPYDLAETVLEIDLSGGAEDWVIVQVASQHSLDQYDGDPTPVADHIGLIFNQVDPARALLWQRHIDEIAAGERDDDIEVTDSERDLIEKAITVEHIHDGSGWSIRSLTLKSSSGYAVNFEVCIGDAGEAFDLLGPYQLATGETNFTDDLVIEPY